MVQQRQGSRWSYRLHPSSCFSCCSLRLVGGPCTSVAATATAPALPLLSIWLLPAAAAPNQLQQLQPIRILEATGFYDVQHKRQGRCCWFGVDCHAC